MKTRIILVGLIAVLFTNGCKKEKADPEPEPGKATYSIRMTDGPGPYTAVNVDVQGVEITSDNGVADLNVNAGVYNLLDFTNGADTLIATGSVTAGRIQQVRLILGPNNSLAIGTSTYALVVPSGSQSGLKINVHQDLEAGVSYMLLLDFDANQSIIREGNGGYSLRPVIRAVDQAISGAIKGTVTPAGVNCAVTATNSAGAYSTAVDSSGGYLIRGVPAGTYSLVFIPDTPYAQSVVHPVQVSTGSTTPVSLHAL